MHQNDVVEYNDDGRRSPAALDGGRRRSSSADGHQSPPPQLPGNLSSGSSVSSFQNSSNTGRKGDPRMHRAVSVRLSNPNASLFDALKIGGFEYENDIDSNLLDSEQITLGQRKNQLSRRVRLARQQKNRLGISERHGRLDKSENSSPSRAADADASSNVSASGSSRVRSKANTNTNNKRPLLLEEGYSGLLEDPAARMSYGFNGDDASMSEHTRLIARNHPGYHPILLQQRKMARPTNRESCMVNGYFINHNMDEVPGNAQSFPIPEPPALSFEVSDFGYAPAPSSFAETSNFNPMFNMLPDGQAMDAVGMGRHTDAAAQTIAGSHNYRRTFNKQMDKFPQQQRVGSNVVTNSASRSGSLNSLSARASAASQQEKQPHSGMTITSHNQMASSAGLSLEQLGMALHNRNNLAPIIVPKGTMPTQARQDLAVSLYQVENCALYQRSMLLAGYSPNIAQDERSHQHLHMAFSAWQAEGRRLAALRNELQGLEANTPAPGHNGGSSGQSDQSPDRQGQDGNASSNQHFTSYNHGGNESYHQDDGHGQHGQHHHHHSHSDIQSEHGRGACAFESGRHNHRLEGRCGHQAIVHHPADGAAHIDFVVGDRIECYRGLEPLSSHASDNSASPIKVWPSSYKCKELSCKHDCRDTQLECKSKNSKDTHPDCCVAGDPKIYNTDDVDLQGDEWNSDFSNGDSVLGLFKLGAETKSSSS